MTDRLIEEERDFYNLCYDQYKRELDSAESIYQRAGVLLTAIPVIGAVAFGLGRLDLVPHLLSRVDTFFYCLSAAGAWAALSVSIAFLMATIYPRRYCSVAPMKEWHEWVEDYRKRFTNRGKALSEDERKTIGAELIRSLTPLLANAQTECARANEKRRGFNHKAVKAVCIAVACIAVEAAFNVILHLQGI